MKYVLIPPLEQMTLVKIAAELWNQDDIKKSIKEFKLFKFFPLFHTEWQDVEVKVREKVSLLPLPLKNDVLCIIKPIGRQIHTWCEDHHRGDDKISVLPERFCWTAQGTIDRRKTVELLLKDEDLDLSTRYRLSCIYCLEKEIPELWNRIPMEKKRLFYTNGNRSAYYNVNDLVEYWTYHLISEYELNYVIRKVTGRSNVPPHVHAFRCAVEGGNVTATRFFFDKLSDEERETLLVELAEWSARKRVYFRLNEDYHSQVLFFLMSKMSENQQVQLLAKCPYNVLCCCVDWPFQPFFIDLARQIVMRRSTEDQHPYLSLLLSITHKIKAGWMDINYGQLFQRVWGMSPDSLKREALDERVFVTFILSDLFAGGEKTAIESVFEHMNELDKQHFMSWTGIVKILIDENRWVLVEFLLEITVPTKKMLLEVKNGLMRHRSLCKQSEKGNGSMWDAFCSMLYELVAKKLRGG